METLHNMNTNSNWYKMRYLIVVFHVPSFTVIKLLTLFVHNQLQT